MKATVKVRRAYTTFNNAVETEKFAIESNKFLSKTFEAVAHREMATNLSEILVLQAPSADISRFRTTNVNVTEHQTFFKQQTVISATNLFTAATNVLQSHRGLKKVVIVEQAPRYDSSRDDPDRLKQTLVQIYNDTLVQLKRSSSQFNKISIAKHRLDCSGGIQEAR